MCDLFFDKTPVMTTPNFSFLELKTAVTTCRSGNNNNWTAINQMDRFTGVISLEGGPINHRYHEAYQELASYVKVAAHIDANQAIKAIDAGIPCKKWESIFKQNLNTEVI